VEVSNKNMVRDWSAYSEACEEQHDLITALLYRNLDHIALEIFEYLDTFGLTSVAAVCTTWSAFIEENINKSSRVIAKWTKCVPQPQSLRCRDTIQTISLSGYLVACGLQNGEVQVWSLLTHSLLAVVADHGSPVTAVGIARLPYDTLRQIWPVLVLTGSWKGEVRIYSVHDQSPLCPIRLNRKLIKSISINGSIAAVACVEFTAMDKCAIAVLDMSSSGAVVRKVLRAGVGLSALHLAEGRLVAGGGYDREGWVKTWRVLDRATCSRQIFNKEDGSPLECWRCAGGWVTAVAQLNSGQIVLAGDSKGRIWVYKCGQMLTGRSPFTSPIISITLDRDLIMIGSYCGCVAWKLTDLQECNNQAQIDEVQRISSPVPVTAIQHQRHSLLASAADGQLLIYDFSKNKIRRRKESESECDFLALTRSKTNEIEPLSDGCILCGSGDESPLHFFLQCPALARPRHQLIQNLERVVPGIRVMNKDKQLDMILYGVDDPDQSVSIRDHVESFIIKAKS